MIFNTKISGGGIKEEDINAELLQTLDPDFKADNIAEGVNMFGRIGTFAGSFKAAAGRATITGDTYSYTIACGFTPNAVIFINEKTDNGSTIAHVIIRDDKLGYSRGKSWQYNTSKADVCTFNSDGFTVNASAIPSGKFCVSGNTEKYYWAALKY